MAHIEITVNTVDENPARHFPAMVLGGDTRTYIQGPRMGCAGSFWSGFVGVAGTTAKIDEDAAEQIAATILDGLTFPRLRVLEVAA